MQTQEERTLRPPPFKTAHKLIYQISAIAFLFGTLFQLNPMEQYIKSYIISSVFLVSGLVGMLLANAMEVYLYSSYSLYDPKWRLNLLTSLLMVMGFGVMLGQCLRGDAKGFRQTGELWFVLGSFIITLINQVKIIRILIQKKVNGLAYIRKHKFSFSVSLYELLFAISILISSLILKITKTSNYSNSYSKIGLIGHLIAGLFLLLASQNLHHKYEMEEDVQIEGKGKYKFRMVEAETINIKQ